jgi:hypothetical protein
LPPEGRALLVAKESQSWFRGAAKNLLRKGVSPDPHRLICCR